MNAGLPGTGIGGLFYIACALLMPIHRVMNASGLTAQAGITVFGGPSGEGGNGPRDGRSWRRVRAQGAIAVGILLSLFTTGWMLGLVVATRHSPAGAGAVPPEVQSFVRWVALVGTAGLLATVLGVVEVASFVFGRGERADRSLRVASFTGKGTGSGRAPNASLSRYDTAKLTLPLLLLFLVPIGTNAQTTAAPPAEAMTSAEAQRLLAEGDAAFARGDSATAREAYRSLLTRTPDQSRAVYQLARMEPPGSEGQLGLFRRYTELEPQDAWGFLALGQAFEDAGEPQLARDAYARALALEPSSQETQEAVIRLNSTGPQRPLSLRIEPLGRVSGDSDNNRSTRAGLSVTASTSAKLILGAVVSRVEVSDDQARVAAWEGQLAADWQPSRALLLIVRSGIVMADRLEAGPAPEPTAQLRLRWRPARASMVMDVRVRREPLQATPHLFQTPVILSEARGTIELPFVSVLHLRGFGRYGQLAAPDEVNERTTWGGGPTLQLPAGVELNSSYARTAYARPTTAGYFAPQRVDALDAGLYAEPSPWGPFSLVVDVGGGAERVTRYSADDSGGGILSGGDWQPALRLWMQASWALGAVGEIRVEVEAYQTQMADAVTSDASMWRWGSLGLSTVWRP